MQGFDALMLAFAETGQALVVMINANDNSGMMNRIVAGRRPKVQVARAVVVCARRHQGGSDNHFRSKR